MSTNNDEDITLEYLKLLLPKGEQSASEFNNAVGKFFLYSLIFFVFAQFQTTELTLFGAKVNIPQEWISAIAPLVLTFYYLRIISLYELQENYTAEIGNTAKKLFGSSKLSKIQAAKISKTIFWFVTSAMMETKKDFLSLLYLIGYIVINGVAYSIIFIFPLIIITYFNFIIWKLNALPPLVIIVISILSALFSFTGIILSIHQFRSENSRNN